MDYEQKYKEALERAKDMLSYKEVRKEDMEYLFPELAESEDEKIKKEIIAVFKGKIPYTSEEDAKRYIAWLEKQGEKKKKSDFSNIRIWKYIVDTVLTEKDGIGNYLDNPDTERIAKKLQEKYGNIEKQSESNPYSGVSFKYNGHIWGMCARDNGVEILFDGELKAFLSLEKSFIYPIYPKIDLAHIAHKSACGVAKEEKVDNQNCIKHIENVESKFKVRDWCIDNEDGTIFQIVKVLDNTYRYKTNEGKEYSSTHYSLENDARLWTIQDAKDGDVLTDGKLIVIFNKLEEPAYRQHIIAYIGLDLCGRLQITEDTWQLGVDKAMPATKEQRDLLFQKMKEEGYEWDAEKKVLKKIEPKTLDANKVIAWLIENDDDFWKSPCNPQNIINQFKKYFNL